MLLANGDMAPLKAQQKSRGIVFVQWMGLIFLSGFMFLIRRIRTNPNRKVYVFVNNRLEGNPLQTMKVILSSAEHCGGAHLPPAGILGGQPARQLPLR